MTEKTVSVPTESRPTKCPTCDSPAAHLHPAMQFEGEVQPCENEWHNHERGKESWERDADLRAAARKHRAENGQPELPDIERAYQWLLKSDDLDARNLRSTIKKTIVAGADCFDLRGVAKVLAKFAASSSLLPVPLENEPKPVK